MGPKGAALLERQRDDPPLSELEFPGCYLRPMTFSEYEDHEGRVEFFDSRAGLACLASEAAHFAHEMPLRMLGPLLERIAQMRGSPIVFCGQAEIRRVLTGSEGTRHIQPDEMVFLDPARLDRMASPYLNAGEDPYPDVVVEVDSTTDVRRNRLKLYEAWGFPEVWVEVPDAYAPSRPAGLQSGLRIYLLEGGRYAPSEASRAFPGWLAAEIHGALNERVISEETSEILSRVGRALGERSGGHGAGRRPAAPRAARRGTRARRRQDGPRAPPAAGRRGPCRLSRRASPQRPPFDARRPAPFRRVHCGELRRLPLPARLPRTLTRRRA